MKGGDPVPAGRRASSAGDAHGRGAEAAGLSYPQGGGIRMSVLEELRQGKAAALGRRDDSARLLSNGKVLEAWG